MAKQQLTYPLDAVSQSILAKMGFLKFVGIINTVGVGGVEFPFAIVVSVNNKYYFLSSAGTLYSYAVNPVTDVFTMIGSTINPFQNGNAVIIYTDNQEPAPLVAGGSIIYFVTSVSGTTFKLSLTLAAVFTVSGITTAPTAGAIYTDDRLNSFTVVSTSLSGSPKAGTITFSGSSSNSFPTGTLTKISGTGDSSIAYTAVTFNGGSAIDITSAGLGNQFIAFA